MMMVVVVNGRNVNGVNNVGVSVNGVSIIVMMMMIDFVYGCV